MLSLLSIWIVLAPLVVIRGLRWLAIVQQKEYRWDRLRAFFRSDEGRQDVLRLWPRRQDFTRQGLKRPALTFRILVVKLIAIKLCSVVLLTISSPFLVQAFVSLVIYVMLPVIIMVSIVPTALLSMTVTYLTQMVAKQRLKAGKPMIIGITGSYGKSSTKLLLAHVLARKYSVFYTPRSFNTRYSVARSIVKGYRDQSIAILEYGAYTMGEIKFLTKWFPPSKAVVTGLTPQHLELFGSMEKIIAAKSELPRAVPVGEKVFCNAADEGAEQICTQAHQATMVPYSGPDSVIELKQVALAADAQLTFVWKDHPIVTQLVGLHYLTNVKAAIAVAQHMGVTEPDIVQALKSFVPSTLFMQIKKTSTGVTIIDDGGTTNPAGFRAALEVLKWYRSQAPSKKKVLITAGIVDLGTRSDTIHTELANQARSIVDEVWYMGAAGQSSFKSIFGNRQITDIAEVKRQLSELATDTIVLIEGKVPAWVNHAINL